MHYRKTGFTDCINAPRKSIRYEGHRERFKTGTGGELSVKVRRQIRWSSTSMCCAIAPLIHRQSFPHGRWSCTSLDPSILSHHPWNLVWRVIWHLNHIANRELHPCGWKVLIPDCCFIDKDASSKGNVIMNFFRPPANSIWEPLQFRCVHMLRKTDIAVGRSRSLGRACMLYSRSALFGAPCTTNIHYTEPCTHILYPIPTTCNQVSCTDKCP